MGPGRTRTIFCYALAIMLPLAAIGGLGALRAVTAVSDELPLLLIPVLLIGYLGRLGPGLIATATVVLGASALLGFDVLRVVTIAGIGTWITVAFDALRRARYRAERSQVASELWERRFTRAFEASPSAMSLSRLDDRTLVAVNDAYLRLFQTDRHRVIGRTPYQAGVDISEPVRDQLIEQLRRGEPLINHEMEIGTAHGPRTILLSSQVIELEGVAHAMSTFLDLTERRQAEARARASDQQFRQLAESVQGAFWLTNADNSEVFYVSPGYARVFGRPVEALYANPRDWLDAVHPEDLPRVRAASQPSMDISVGSSIDSEFRIVRPDGERRHVRVKLFPVRDHHGTSTRMGGMAEDISDQVELEAQLRETQKLESIGLLAGGVAHDFNNVLAVISANIGMLGEAVAPDHPDRDLVDEIDAAVVRATGLTRQLLAFSRKQVVEPVVLDLNTAVNDTRKMLRRMVGEDIVIVSSLEPELRPVRMDPGYLVQVLMNLVVNARDAMPRGGQLAITTRNLIAAGRPEVVLSVSDGGVGIPPEIKARVFEPFFTTKGVGKGTGLGLSVVHGIIKQAGGRIEIESAVDVGTTFRIYLPAVDAPLDSIADLVTAARPGTERVLVVDDDRFVRSAAARALRARGYTVLEAAEGAEALRLLRHHGEALALLVTDIVMPGMDGPELARIARTERPALKILFCSGYTDDALTHHGVPKEGVWFLEKPFRNHALAAKVRQVLDAPAGMPGVPGMPEQPVAPLAADHARARD